MPKNNNTKTKKKEYTIQITSIILKDLTVQAKNLMDALDQVQDLIDDNDASVVPEFAASGWQLVDTEINEVEVGEKYPDEAQELGLIIAATQDDLQNQDQPLQH